MKYLFYLAILFIINCESNSESKTQEEEESPYLLTSLQPMPQARQEIYPGLVNDKLFVLGGFSDQQRATKSLYIYDIPSNSWSSGAELPETRHHISVSQFGDDVYAIGGYTGDEFGWTIKDDIFKYNLQNKSWTTHAKMSSARAEHVSAVINGYIYIISGTNVNRQTSNKTERYDAVTNQWETLSNIPTGRNSAAVVTINKHIYVIGGRYRDEDRSLVNVSSMEVYHTETDTWTTLTDMPRNSAGLMASSIGNKIYVFGGEIFTTSPITIVSNIFEYDIDTDTWTELDERLGIHGTQAIHYQGRIYIAGGASQPGFGAVRTMVSFRIVQ